MTSFFKTFLILSTILLIKAAVFVWLISQNYIGLGPDEAQYWTWSQHPDWGYYSKPPGIAWQIALTTFFFGNTELGARFGAVIIGTALPLAVFSLAKACGSTPKTAFYSAISIAIVPLGLMSCLLSITDGGLVLFWTLGCVVIALALTNNQPPHYYLLGLAIFGGALYKWPIYYLWVPVFILARFLPHFRTRHLAAGLLLSTLGLIPSLIWNWNRGWVTFKHVAGNITGAENTHAGYQGNFLAFIGEQSLLLSPILFVVLLCALVYGVRHLKSVPLPLAFCGGSSLLFLAAYSTAALFKKMQGNWCDFIYPAAAVFLCWYAIEKTRHGKAWIQVGWVVSLLLSGFVFSLPYIQSHALLSSLAIPFKVNPFKHNLGWDRLSEILVEAGYDPESQFLFSDRYQTSSLLSFYGPRQKPAYFFNLQQIRLNQFSFWPGMAQEQKGKTGYFFVIENSPHMENKFQEYKKTYPELLKRYFKEVRFVGQYPLFSSDHKIVKAAQIYQCVDYNGEEPPHSHLY